MLDKFHKYMANMAISKPDSMPYGDAVMMGNFIKQGQDDIGQTLRKVQSPQDASGATWSEQNPFVKPILNSVSPDAFRAAGLLGNGYLANRWADKNMNGTQRTAEMFLANLIEAAALNYSKEPFTLRFGAQF